MHPVGLVVRHYSKRQIGKESNENLMTQVNLRLILKLTDRWRRNSSRKVDEQTKGVKLWAEGKTRSQLFSCILSELFGKSNFQLEVETKCVCWKEGVFRSQKLSLPSKKVLERFAIRWRKTHVTLKQDGFFEVSERHFITA
ncbi:unnamed protein product [Larinioides sclopetarius]|uniref:Uncharacterized protein n=1 Tax=Larinioides sclopetarius TaxID=280406 RepID=A0AAV2AA94_9ARAC